MRRFDFFPKDPSYGRNRKKKRWKRYFIDDLFEFVRAVFLALMAIPRFVWLIFIEILWDIVDFFVLIFKALNRLFSWHKNLKAKINEFWFWFFENASKPFYYVLKIWFYYYNQFGFSFCWIWVDLLKFLFIFWNFIFSFSYFYIFIVVYGAVLVFILTHLMFLMGFLFLNAVLELGFFLRLREHFIFDRRHRIYLWDLFIDHFGIISNYLDRVFQKELNFIGFFFVCVRWFFLITPFYWAFLLFLLLLRFQLLHFIFLFENLFKVKLKFLFKIVLVLDFLGKWHDLLLVKGFSFIDIVNFLFVFFKKCFNKLFVFVWRFVFFFEKALEIIYKKNFEVFFINKTFYELLSSCYDFIYGLFFYYFPRVFKFYNWGFYFMGLRLVCLRFFKWLYFFWLYFFKRKFFRLWIVFILTFIVIKAKFNFWLNTCFFIFSWKFFRLISCVCFFLFNWLNCLKFLDFKRFYFLFFKVKMSFLFLKFKIFSFLKF